MPLLTLFPPGITPLSHPLPPDPPPSGSALVLIDMHPVYERGASVPFTGTNSSSDTMAGTRKARRAASVSSSSSSPHTMTVSVLGADGLPSPITSAALYSSVIGSSGPVFQNLISPPASIPDSGSFSFPASMAAMQQLAANPLGYYLQAETKAGE